MSENSQLFECGERVLFRICHNGKACLFVGYIYRIITDLTAAHPIFDYAIQYRDPNTPEVWRSIAHISPVGIVLSFGNEKGFPPDLSEIL